MAGYYSSPPPMAAREFADDGYDRFGSPGYIPAQSATPSPRGSYYAAHFPPNQTPQRPATRASHFRHPSSSMEGGSFSPRQTISPRFNSDGRYATGDPNFAFPDDERKTMPRHSAAAAGHSAHASHAIPQRYSETPGPDSSRRSGHSRRASAAAHSIQRPQTARPEASRRSEHHSSSRRPVEATRHHSSKKSHAQPPPPPAPAKASDEDARRAGIPPGYSLKNWDPNEEPILLLGSVFDSNSLGKWIYDWTVHTHTIKHPLADMAGRLWLLLIQLAGKTKRAMKAVSVVRRQDNKEVVEDFINAGERLTDKLRDLLASCEQPMLEASKKGNKSKLGKGAGIEFIETLFGHDRMLHQTEKFMGSIELWDKRYDANVEDIIAEPTR